MSCYLFLDQIYLLTLRTFCIFSKYNPARKMFKVRTVLIWNWSLQLLCHFIWIFFSLDTGIWCFITLCIQILTHSIFFTMTEIVTKSALVMLWRLLVVQLKCTVCTGQAGLWYLVSRRKAVQVWTMI